MTWFGRLIPLWLVVLVASVVGATAAWNVQDWRHGKALADLSAGQANQRADTAEKALSDLAYSAAKIKLGATQYASMRDALGLQLDVISKEFADVRKNHPLPLDCRPDAVRLRSLAAAVDAANSSATGQQSGRTLP